MVSLFLCNEAVPAFLPRSAGVCCCWWARHPVQVARVKPGCDNRPGCSLVIGGWFLAKLVDNQVVMMMIMMMMMMMMMVMMMMIMMMVIMMMVMMMMMIMMMMVMMIMMMMMMMIMEGSS